MYRGNKWRKRQQGERTERPTTQCIYSVLYTTRHTHAQQYVLIVPYAFCCAFAWANNKCYMMDLICYIVASSHPHCAMLCTCGIVTTCSQYINSSIPFSSEISLFPHFLFCRYCTANCVKSHRTALICSLFFYFCHLNLYTTFYGMLKKLDVILGNNKKEMLIVVVCCCCRPMFVVWSKYWRNTQNKYIHDKFKF